MGKVSELDKLTEEYKKWTENNGYPYVSADALLQETDTDDNQLVRGSAHRIYLQEFIERWDRAEEIDSIPQQERDKRVHLAHCYQGENEGGCKYGQHDTCPAKPKDMTGENPLILTDEEIGDLNAWLSFDDEQSIVYGGPKVFRLMREAMLRDGYI